MTDSTPTRPLHTQIEPAAFLDDGVFATRSRGTGIVLRLDPQDSECMEASDKDAIARRYESAMRLLEPGDRAYQYLLKRKLDSPSRLYSYDSFLVLLRDRMDTAGTRALAEAFAVQVSSALGARILNKREAFAFLRAVLNYDPLVARAVALKHDDYIGYFAADSPVERHRDHLRVGDHYVKVLTLKDQPLRTVADCLRALREMKCEAIIASEWKPLDMVAARAMIKGKKTHFYLSKWPGSIAEALLKFFTPGSAGKTEQKDKEKDDASEAMELQLGELMKDIEKNGTAVGEYALTVILLGDDHPAINKAAAEAFHSLAGSEATLYAERLNVLHAWLATLPGGYKHQRRAMYLTNRNYADMAMLFGPARGERRNAHLNAPCLAVLETRQETPHFANLHYGDVGHALCIGMTGSGKSYLLNFLVSAAKARYDARVVIFDIGGSYKALTREAGGSYMEIGLRHDFTINPCALEDTEANRQFVFSFAKVLIESGGHRMTDIEKHALFGAVPGATRLRELAARLPAELQPYLARWIGNGQYGSVFDNEADTLTCARFQAFDFDGMDLYPEILEPLLFYVLHRANSEMSAATARHEFKVFVVDEAWRFFQNETTRQYIHNFLKTGRKQNKAMWLATQSLGDMEQSRMLATVAENCGALILMPNPRMDRAEYKGIFKLNETELNMVAAMRPRAESLWKPAVGPSKVLVLDTSQGDLCSIA